MKHMIIWALLMVCCVGCEASVTYSSKPQTKERYSKVTVYSGDKAVRVFKASYVGYFHSRVHITNAETNEDVVLFGTIVVEKDVVSEKE